MSEMPEKHDWVRLSRLGHQDIIFPNLLKTFEYLQKTSPGYALGHITKGDSGRASMCDNGPYMDVVTWSIPVYYNGNAIPNDYDGKIVIYRCV